MRSFRQVLAIVALLSTVALVGCGGGSGSSGSSVIVSVAPTSVTVAIGSTQAFFASVTGTTNSAVTWQVNGITGGSSTVGTIGTDGTYTAPQSVPSGGSVTVTAVSQAEPSASGSSHVLISSSVQVAVSPPTATVGVGITQVFTATITGSNNQAVDWSVNGVLNGNSTVGTIDVNGYYTGPQLVPSPSTVTVTATSQAYSNSSGDAAVTVVPILEISPAGVDFRVGGPQQGFVATVSGETNNTVNWSVSGVAGGNNTLGTITADGLYTPPDAIPDPSNITVTATLQADPTESVSAPCTVDAGGSGVNQQGQSLPIKLGTSGGNKNDISTQFCCSGTLGSLVSRGGTQFVLSNNHVLADTDAGKVGDIITQPGLVDTGCQPGTSVATLTQFIPLLTGTPPADAAIAQVVSGAVNTSGSILQLGNVSSGIASDAPPANTTEKPEIGMTVAKSGRTTGLQCSTIAAVDLSVQVQYETTCGSSTGPVVTFSNQVDIESDTFSDSGDSGSLIVDSQTSQPVALLFAGGGTSTIANPINTVLSNLADTKTGELPVFVGTSTTQPVPACTGIQNQNGILPNAFSPNSIPVETLNKAMAVKEANVVSLMADPAVIGVGVGVGDVAGEAAIMVWVDKTKTHLPIPATLEGIKTIVKSTAKFRARTGERCSAN